MSQDDRRDVAAALALVDWSRVAAELDDRGYGLAGPLLGPAERAGLVADYGDDGRYRKRVVMERHAYGRGEYRYFGYPLPPIVQRLREAAYPPLAAIANRWSADLGLATRYPERLDDYIAGCHAAGQRRPTPLILKYGPGDYNRLHQDLYGTEVFPLQMIVLLSVPGQDFEGGELVLTEQRARMQSRAEVVPLAAGEAAIIAVNDRPGRGPRGFHRLRMRHGVSRLRAGSRYTLGIIFHDAA